MVVPDGQLWHTPLMFTKPALQTQSPTAFDQLELPRQMLTHDPLWNLVPAGQLWQTPLTLKKPELHAQVFPCQPELAGHDTQMFPLRMLPAGQRAQYSEGSLEIRITT